MTSKQPSEPAQQPSRFDWRRIGITVLFLLITLALIFLSSQWAIFFIDRSQIPGGIFSRSQADYGSGVSIALAPLDRDRIIAEIIADELSLSAQNVSPLAGSIVIALLPRITPQLFAAVPSPTPVPATVVVVAPASPTPTPDVAATTTPTDSPATPSPLPSPSPTSTPTSIIPTTPTPTSTSPSTPTPTSTSPPTPTPTSTLPPTSTPTSTSPPTQSPSTPTATSVPSTPQNQPPQTTDDVAVLDEDTTLVINVLDDDTDPDGSLDLNSLSVVIQPLHGTATVVTGTIIVTPTIVYSPVSDYSGTDTFTYQVCDLAGACSTAIVTITVIGLPDAPVAGDDNGITNEDFSINIPVLANDSDVDNDPLSISMVGTPVSGTAIRVGSSITYTPNRDFYGQDSFTYVVSDGLLTDTGTVSVTVLPVNDAPVAVNDSAFTAEDSPEDIPVRSNDIDVDGDLLTVVAIGQPLNGTTTTNGSSVVYTPFPNYNGTDTFTYTISDGQESDSATVTVTVISINDRPTARNDTYSTAVNTPLNIGPPGVLTNDSDPEGTPLTTSLVSGPTSGTLLLNINGSFIYTPTANFAGTDTFTYEASDGAAFSAPATVTVNVTN